MKKIPSVRTFWKNLFWVSAMLIFGVIACNFPGSWGKPSAEADLIIPGPVVAFQEPAAGMQVDLDQPFAIFVTASDTLGVVRLDLWVDGVLVLSQPAPETDGVNPLVLSYGMIGSEPGTYALVARAYNSLGAMGESLAVHVTVSSEQVAAPAAPEQVLYIVQPGDSLADVADVTGNSYTAIKAANPGVNDFLNPGQVIVVQGASANQPPAQPAQPPAGQQGGQAAALPGLLPIQPGAGGAPPAIPPAQGNVAHIAPNLFPQFKPPQNAANLALSAPEAVTATASDCKVTLNWVDNSTNESGFAIYRRLKPGQVSPQYILTVPTDQTSYVDEVPYSGTFEYTVEAQGEIEIAPPDQAVADVIQQDMFSASRSAPVYVEVKPTSACIADPDRVKYIHVQPINVTPKYGGAGYAALWFSINNSPGRRVPGDQGQYIATGDWSVPDSIIPVTGSFFLNPDQNIIAKFWSAVTTLDFWSDPRGPTDLGEAFNAHAPADISVNDGSYYIAENAASDGFKVEYKIWLEEMKWTGQGTTSKIPAPINLRVKSTTTNSRIITWDWDRNNNKHLLDGYILYKSYSCPGMDTQIYAPVMIPAAQQEAQIPFRSEPVGCLYRYQVSAYGRAGESGRSNPLEGNTEAAYAIAGITFKTLKINDMPYGPGGAQLKVFANQHRRTSSTYWLKETSYGLGGWTFDGRQPHNAMSMALAEREFLTVGFSVSGVDSQGYVAQDSVCKGGSIVPPVDAWAQDPWTLTIKSSSGDCELTIELTGQSPQTTSSGGIVMPQADIVVSNIAHVGNKLFAYIENNGPDDLPNNSFYVRVGWGDRCATENKNSAPWGLGRTVHVQSNLPQWVYLHEDLDQVYARYTTTNEFPDYHDADCGYGAFVMVAPPAKDNQSFPNFTDPEMARYDYYDEFFMPFDRIGIMK